MAKRHPFLIMNKIIDLTVQELEVKGKMLAFLIAAKGEHRPGEGVPVKKIVFQREGSTVERWIDKYGHPAVAPGSEQDTIQNVSQEDSPQNLMNKMADTAFKSLAAIKEKVSEAYGDLAPEINKHIEKEYSQLGRLIKKQFANGYRGSEAIANPEFQKERQEYIEQKIDEVTDLPPTENIKTLDGAIEYAKKHKAKIIGTAQGIVASSLMFGAVDVALQLILKRPINTKTLTSAITNSVSKGLLKELVIEPQMEKQKYSENLSNTQKESLSTAVTMISFAIGNALGEGMILGVMAGAKALKGKFAPAIKQEIAKDVAEQTSKSAEEVASSIGGVGKQFKDEIDDVGKALEEQIQHDMDIPEMSIFESFTSRTFKKGKYVTGEEASLSANVTHEEKNVVTILKHSESHYFDVSAETTNDAFAISYGSKVKDPRNRFSWASIEGVIPERISDKWIENVMEEIKGTVSTHINRPMDSEQLDAVHNWLKNLKVDREALKAKQEASIAGKIKKINKKITDLFKPKNTPKEAVKTPKSEVIKPNPEAVKAPEVEVAKPPSLDINGTSTDFLELAKIPAFQEKMKGVIASLDKEIDELRRPNDKMESLIQDLRQYHTGKPPKNKAEMKKWYEDVQQSLMGKETEIKDRLQSISNIVTTMLTKATKDPKIQEKAQEISMALEKLSVNKIKQFTEEIMEHPSASGTDIAALYVVLRNSDEILNILEKADLPNLRLMEFLTTDLSRIIPSLAAKAEVVKPPALPKAVKPSTLPKTEAVKTPEVEVAESANLAFQEKMKNSIASLSDQINDTSANFSELAKVPAYQEKMKNAIASLGKEIDELRRPNDKLKDLTQDIYAYMKAKPKNDIEKKEVIEKLQQSFAGKEAELKDRLQNLSSIVTTTLTKVTKNQTIQQEAEKLSTAAKKLSISKIEQFVRELMDSQDRTNNISILEFLLKEEHHVFLDILENAELARLETMESVMPEIYQLISNIVA